jgi:hypothetical protein
MLYIPSFCISSGQKQFLPNTIIRDLQVQKLTQKSGPKK